MILYIINILVDDVVEYEGGKKGLGRIRNKVEWWSKVVCATFGT